MANGEFRGTIADGDLRLLRVFVSVADHGGFSGAEVALNKTKSAISLDITHLERRLGIVLCTRGRAGFALTDEGRTVYDAAIGLLGDIDSFQDKVTKATGKLRGTVSVHLVDNINSIAEQPLARATAEFTARHPEVQIRFTTGAPRHVEQAILDGTADLAVSVLARPVSSLELTPLFSEEIRLYCANTHPLFEVRDTEIDLDVLSGYACVEISVADDHEFTAMIRDLDFAARASNLDARIILILSGAFLGFLPTHYARQWQDRGEIREVLPGTLSTQNRFYLMTNRSARPNTAADALAGILAQHLHNQNPR